MGRLIVVIAIIAGVAYAWHKGYLGQWFNKAVDSSIDSVRSTQREATKVRPADAPSEDKK
jgi:hypothetical protein